MHVLIIVLEKTGNRRLYRGKSRELRKFIIR
jgi:hypothetical protein